MKNDTINTILASSGPFGDSDGTRADIKEIINGFINFSEFSGFSGLAFSEDDKYKRIIVGKKGSGKTIYLRRIQKLFLDDDSVYVSEISYDPPKTRFIIKVSEWSNVEEISELWTEIWKAAILRTVYTHIFYSAKLKSTLSQRAMNKFIGTYESLLPKNKKPISVYTQVKNICSSFHSHNDLTKYLDNPLWDDFEIEIGNIINKAKPIFLFIDAVDEDYSHAPLHWLRCQKGLFFAIYRLLRNQSFGGRLHISICIRQSVMAHVLRGEHMSRYVNDFRIKKLEWDKSSVFHFLDRKIEMLDDYFFLGDFRVRGKNIYTLLGIDEIEVIRSNIVYKEDIKDYIIRHTRLLPRDIVNIGNAICRRIQESKKTLTLESPNDILKSSIHICAKAIAVETLAWCANQQTSNWMFNGAYEHDLDELYTSNQEMIKGATSYFRELILAMNKDRLSFDEINYFYINRVEFGFSLEDNPFDILWQFGLLGYKDSSGEEANKEVFFHEISSSGFNLPLKRDEYIFHSCIIDLLNITAVGPPIYV